MKKSGILLILVIVFGLSLGPLTYFTGGGEEKIPPKKNESQGDQFKVASSNFTGEAQDLSSHVYFQGVKSNNNIAEAREEIESVSKRIENYSVDMELTSSGNNWLYTVEVPVNSTSEASEIGFKLAFRLSMLYDGSVTYREAQVKMPKTLDAVTSEGNQVKLSTDNKTVNSNLVYSVESGEKVKVRCPKIISSLNNIVTEVPSRCAQRESTFFDYGITQSMFLKNGDTEKLNRTLELSEIDRFVARYGFNSSTDITEDLLKNVSGIVNFKPVKNNTDGSVTFKASSRDELNSTGSYLESRGFYRAEDYKVGMVDISDNYTFGNRTYEIIRPELDELEVKLPMNGPEEGEIKTEIRLRLLYGEIFGASAKYISE